MNFELKTVDLERTARDKCDALIVLVGSEFASNPPVAAHQCIGQALQAGDLEGEAGKTLALYRHPAFSSPRVVLANVAGGDAKSVRMALAAAWPLVRSPGVRRLVVCWAQPGKAAALRAAVTTLADLAYRYTATKSKPDSLTLQKLLLTGPDFVSHQQTFDRAVAIAEGSKLAREWANRPANHATPAHLAQAAQALTSGRAKMACEVLGLKEVSKLRMGAFMAVAQGSAQPLQFIILRYQGAAKSKAPLVLVGKGITFDSGGISLKPGQDMDEMKFDMAGAASVLGAFEAIARLKPSCNVIGLIPACENLPSSHALKPGDVIASMNGTTIEVLNTDAEGRLVLCDALSYAERFNPAAVVDIATLTGACVIALGGVRSGLFSSDDALATELLEAGEQAQDFAWRMPLDDDYADGLKTSFADVANVAGRAGGSISAAKFLQRFVKEYPWAHLDIAGTAWKSGASKGATGRPVGLLVEWVLARAQSVR